jgi:hypothetical protein
MHLDTTQLKSKIQNQIVRAGERIREIETEMQRLQDEIPRLQEAMKTLEVVERIASDYEVFPEPASTDPARRREFSQSLVGPALEKLGAEMGLEIPPPPTVAPQSPASPEEASEQDQFFAQWH